MFTSLLVANRGEIACRIMRTARRMGLRTIAVYGEDDEHALHVRTADEAEPLGRSRATTAYLDIDNIMAAVRRSKAEALHPGYGFLSENRELAGACASAGVVFVGPPVQAMRLMGLKDEAKRIMEAAGVPVTPGYHGEDQSDKTLLDEARNIGLPVLIKAVAGGGGRGMRRVDTPDAFLPALASARREARAAFGNDRVLIEKYIPNPRHIEVQVFGDRRGRIAHFYERDCSVQRRHQKIIEEAPAPGISSKMRSLICTAAVNAARAVAYENAGTVEFIADGSGPLRPDRFWFMEMNTRLQVEHPVSEAVTGYDLVELQLKVAAGGSVPEQDQIYLRGHAIEARLYAEDPAHAFRPSAGRLAHFVLPEGDDVRVDTGFVQGGLVSPLYDPMLAKAIAHAPTRKLASTALAAALERAQSWPVRTNAGLLGRIVRAPDFQAGRINTGFVEDHAEELLDPARNLHRQAALTALVAQACAETSAANAGPWQRHDGWRLNRSPVLSRVFMLEGQSVTVRLHHTGPLDWRLACADWQMDVQQVRVDAKGVRYVCDGLAHRAQNLRFGDTLVTFDNGEAWSVRAPGPDATAQAAQASAALLAPLPGKVLSVIAKAGTAAPRGQPLVVLEAMKMEHALAATADSLVAEVLVQAGQQVSEGDVLVRFKVSADD